MPYKKSSRAWGNKEKKGHLVNVLAYAVHNMEKLKGEKDRRRLRAIARSLYLTAAGVRVNYEGHELVTMFKELTAGCVLLTLGQSAASARKYDGLPHGDRGDRLWKRVGTRRMRR